MDSNWEDAYDDPESWDGDYRAWRPRPRTYSPPPCPYCGKAPRLWEDSRLLHNGVDFGPAWVCGGYPGCDAYVGCHPGTKRPLGRLANTNLRAMRRLAHAALDPFWQSDGLRDHSLTPQQARLAAYEWLAGKLKICTEDCHIGLFDEATCKRVVAACQKRLSKTLGLKNLPL